jgi:hypothetical protein
MGRTSKKTSPPGPLSVSAEKVGSVLSDERYMTVCQPASATKPPPLRSYALDWACRPLL